MFLIINNFIKRVIDIVASLLGLIILSPIFIILIIAVKSDSKGPVLFKQGRLKKDGKVFTMLKFRSMKENAEFEGTGLFNFENDPRITKVGSFLRKSSLDEIPQLINILRGDMSIVGPRPCVTYELGNYEDLTDRYKRRFLVKPGLTGLAQVTGRNDNDWDEKVTLDNLYIDKYNKYGILLDVKIIVMTIFAVCKSENITENEDELEGLSEEEKKELAMKKVIEKASKKGE